MNDAYDSLVRAAEARSKRLDDPCKHLTRCADAACGYRMEAAEDAAVAADQSRPVPRASDTEGRLAQIVPRLERARDEWDAPLGASYARQIWDRAISEVRAVLDAAPVAATPPQGIDRDALADLHRATTALALMLPGEVYDDYRQRLDRVLALVRPIEGVVLSREEASACSWALDHLVAVHDYDGLRGRDGSRIDLEALAARLEAAQ